MREEEEMEARERALQEQQERERRLDILRQQVCVHIRSYELVGGRAPWKSESSVKPNFEFCFC